MAGIGITAIRAAPQRSRRPNMANRLRAASLGIAGRVQVAATIAPAGLSGRSPGKLRSAPHRSRRAAEAPGHSAARVGPGSVGAPVPVPLRVGRARPRADPRGRPPGRSRLGRSPERSTTVLSRPTGHGPPSRTSVDGLAEIGGDVLGLGRAHPARRIGARCGNGCRDRMQQRLGDGMRRDPHRHGAKAGRGPGRDIGARQPGQHQGERTGPEGAGDRLRAFDRRSREAGAALGPLRARSAG